jgi:hypothetical protein
MATQYDSVIGPYINKNTMENSDYSASCKPSCGMMHAVECQPRFNPLGVLYTSGGISNTQLPLTGSNAYPTNTDVRFQNLGLFQIASTNIPTASSGATVDLGEIWVHFKVRMYKPQLNAGLYNILSASYSSTSYTSALPLLNMTAGNGNYLPLQFTNITGFTTGNYFAFPLAVTEGTFLVTYVIKGASTAVISAPLFTAGQACTILSIMDNASQPDTDTNSWSPLTGTTSQNYMVTCVVKVDAPGAQLAVVSLGSGTLPAAGRAQLFVTPWNLSMTS